MIMHLSLVAYFVYDRCGQKVYTIPFAEYIIWPMRPIVLTF